MTTTMAVLLLCATAATADPWRVLFVADAGPVVLVDLSSTPRQSEKAIGLSRRADVTLVTASGQASFSQSDEVAGVPPTASGVPGGAGTVSTLALPNGIVSVTVSSAPALVEVLRAFAGPGAGPPVADAHTFRITLYDAISDDGADRAVQALLATTAGVLPGRAVVGRQVIPQPGSPTLLFTAGVSSLIPRDALVVATVEGCGRSLPRALLYREANGSVQTHFGPLGCARGAIVQRAERLTIDKKGVVRTSGVALSPLDMHPARE
jgi:hypothetical protein